VGNIKIISGGPGLWAYVLVLSAIAATLFGIFTSRNIEPSLYKLLVPYAGFVVAIAWVSYYFFKLKDTYQYFEL
jgi:uncharacterized membrane protein YjjB (DUF3815 family)